MQGTITLTNGQQLTLDGLTLAGQPYRSITALLKEVKAIVADLCPHEPRNDRARAERILCKKCNQLVTNPNK